MRSAPDIRVTKEGLLKFKKEKAELLVRRGEILVRLQRAREMGDLSENGAYKAARAELSDTDRRLRQIEIVLRFGKVVESSESGVVGVGSRVTVQDGTQKFIYTIVGNYESDPLKGKLSDISPIGKALLGRKAGESFSFEVPAGKKTFTILEVTS